MRCYSMAGFPPSSSVRPSLIRLYTWVTRGTSLLWKFLSKELNQRPWPRPEHLLNSLSSLTSKKELFVQLASILIKFRKIQWLMSQFVIRNEVSFPNSTPKSFFLTPTFRLLLPTPLHLHLYCLFKTAHLAIKETQLHYTFLTSWGRTFKMSMPSCTIRSPESPLNCTSPVKPVKLT